MHGYTPLAALLLKKAASVAFFNIGLYYPRMRRHIVFYLHSHDCAQQIGVCIHNLFPALLNVFLCIPGCVVPFLHTFFFVKRSATTYSGSLTFSNTGRNVESHSTRKSKSFKLRTFLFDFGMPITTLRAQICFIASVFLKNKAPNAKKLFDFGVQNHAHRRGFLLSGAMTFSPLLYKVKELVFVPGTS